MLKEISTGGQCMDTYKHFVQFKHGSAICKRGRNDVFLRRQEESKDSQICVLRGGVVDGYCWDKLNDVDGYYLRPGITIRDARNSAQRSSKTSTCNVETCCAGPVTTNPKAIEQATLLRPENLDISTAFLKQDDSEKEYMRTYVCDERISFDGFRERYSSLRATALENKQSVLRRLDPCIKCFDESNKNKFCVPTIDGNPRHGFCAQSGKTCGPGYDKIKTEDECPSQQTRLDTQTIAGPNYSGWIVLHKASEVYYV